MAPAEVPPSGCDEVASELPQELHPPPPYACTCELMFVYKCVCVCVCVCVCACKCANMYVRV